MPPYLTVKRQSNLSDLLRPLFFSKARILHILIVAKTTYIAQVTQPSIYFRNKISRLMFGFLWNNRWQLFSQKMALSEPNFGGLGLKDPFLQAVTFQIRRTYKLFQRKDTQNFSFLQYSLALKAKLFDVSFIPTPIALQPAPAYAFLIEKMRTLRSIPQFEDNLLTKPNLLYSLLNPQQVPNIQQQHSTDIWPLAWQTISKLHLPALPKDMNLKTAHRRLPTKDRIQRICHTGTGACPHCGRLETHEHLLLSCPALSGLWRRIFDYLGIPMPTRWTILNHLPVYSNKKDYVIHHLIATTKFAIWKNRNKQMYNNCSRTISQVFFDAFFRFREIFIADCTLTGSQFRRTWSIWRNIVKYDSTRKPYLAIPQW